MTEWRKRTGTDACRFCMSCSNWLTTDYDVSSPDPVATSGSQYREELEQMRRTTRMSLVLIVIPLVLVLGLSSLAWASIAYGSWLRFFGPTMVGGQTQCADSRPSINNTQKPAAGEVKALYGANCLNANNRPPGHLATVEFLLKSGGLVCGFRDWYYNSSTASSMKVNASWDGPNGDCPSGAAYRAYTAGRYYRTDTQNYVTGSYSYSPYLNF